MRRFVRSKRVDQAVVLSRYLRRNQPEQVLCWVLAGESGKNIFAAAKMAMAAGLAVER